MVIVMGWTVTARRRWNYHECRANYPKNVLIQVGDSYPKKNTFPQLDQVGELLQYLLYWENVGKMRCCLDQGWMDNLYKQF